MNENSKETRSGVPSRFRNFATVVYPESAPEGWRDILAGLAVQGFISPLHDKDVNPTGEPKKPHYHVMLNFEGKKSTEQVREIIDEFGGVGVEVVNSSRGYARYLCHLDNPDKAQYDAEGVVCLSGADYAGLIGTAADKHKAIIEMEQFCDRYDIRSFYLLERYASEHRSDWSRTLHDNSAVFMREWLKSRAWSLENNMLHIIDPETGEVLI